MRLKIKNEKSLCVSACHEVSLHLYLFGVHIYFLVYCNKIIQVHRERYIDYFFIFMPITIPEIMPLEIIPIMNIGSL